jgi:Uma2 family endonuclease
LVAMLHEQTARSAPLEYHAFKGTVRMQIEATKKLFTVDEYYRMAEAGILGCEDRVELIDGEIIRMSPVGYRHVTSVNLANDLFAHLFRGRAIVSVQNPLRLSNYTEPEPDLVLLKFQPDFYRNTRFTPADVLLVLEVADTSLRYDRDVKLSRYAAAAVPEVWIVNLEDDELLTYRNPAGNTYTTQETFGRGTRVSVAAFQEVLFDVDDIFG